MGNSLGRRRVEEPEIVFESSDNADEEEPLDLSVLPHEMLWLVIEKLDYSEYGRLRESCRYMDQVCDTKEFRLECEFPQIEINKDEILLCKKFDYEFDQSGREPVVWKDLDPTASIDTRLAVVKFPFTSEDAHKLLDLFSDNYTKIAKLRFEDRILCEPKELELLIQMTQVGFLDCQQFLRAEYFTEEVMDLRSLTVLHCNFTDRQLSQWNGENLFVRNDDISDAAINRLLKRWKTGNLDFMTIDIEFDTTIGHRNFDVLLEGLDANPIWTPALHDFSAIAQIPLAQFDTTGDPDHLYSMWRSEDPEDVKIIRLTQRGIDVMTYRYELDYLYGYLSEEQYTLVEMCTCGTNDCIHRFMLRNHTQTELLWIVARQFGALTLNVTSLYLQIQRLVDSLCWK